MRAIPFLESIVSKIFPSGTRDLSGTRDPYARTAFAAPGSARPRIGLAVGLGAAVALLAAGMPTTATAQQAQPFGMTNMNSTTANAQAAIAKKKVQAATPKAASKSKPHRLIIQVNQNDPAVMNLALNNATNVIDYYRAKGETADVEIITYGPGLNMLRTDTSPVKDRVKHLKDYAFPAKIQFTACGNTKENMEKKEGHAVTVLSEAVVVPSGVVRVMELQEKGWSYVRP